MQHEGPLSVLRALSKGNGAIVVNGGGLAPAGVARGVFCALDKAGLTKCRKFVGVSGGAPVPAALLSGITGRNAREMSNKIIHSGCVMLRLTKYGWQFHFDREKLMRVLEDILDQEAIRKDVRQFLTVGTTANGLSRIIPGNEDPLKAIEASVSIPRRSQPVIVDGEHISDGQLAFDPSRVAHELHTLRILFVSSRYNPKDRHIVEQWLNAPLTWMALWGMAEIRKVALAMEDRFEAGMKYLMDHCPRIEVLHIFPSFPDPYLMPWTTDPVLIDTASDIAYDYTRRLICQAQDEQIL
jgi:predicted patatin/cPLA2 family phospholipase